MEHIQSVPYSVSLRWCFYRLYQEGLYTCKGDYSKWKALSSKARKSFYDDWHPSVLVDSGREIKHQAYGTADEDEGVDTLHRRLIDYSYIHLDHFYKQENTVILMFEAATMIGQFEHYVPLVDLIPLRGDAGIEHKWEIAKHTECLCQRYGNPVTVLYFGDLNAKALVLAMMVLFGSLN